MIMNRILKYLKKNQKQLLDAAGAVLAVALLYLFFHLTGIGCPIKFLTGISCPGCGMTRACISVATFHFRQAWHFHPLVYLLPVALLVYLFRRRISSKIYKILIFTFLLLFVTIYLVRMFGPANDVVVFHPEQGFLFRAIKFIFT
ncbi:MAG: DUF2752 domain-containing protein [Lachnospiraceae bacterium]|nr:DUF2752 domain-containing protein [Lachnospiraceae bacterium]